MDLLRAQSEASHFLEDCVGSLGPLERLADLVVRVDVLDDRGAELRNAGVGATLERLFGQQAKEALHEIQPRGIRWGVK